MRTLLSILLFFMFISPIQAEVRFLSISDIHYGSKNTSGDGHDTDTVLLDTTLKAYAHLTKKVNFIITLGDFPTHMLGYWPAKEVYIKTVFHELYVGDEENKPLFFISGNNDPLWGNYQPFSWEGRSVLDLAEDWHGACAHCKGLVIDGSHMVDEGYYASYVLPGNKDIVLIALNSTPFAKTPIIMPGYPHQAEDAARQLAWLEGTLKKHHAKQLLLAMHIPPGMSYKNTHLWQQRYQEQLIELLNQWSSHYGQITLLTAHTHMDDVRKIELKNGKNIYAFATPSISRIHHNNPAMKIFDLDSNHKLKDYTTYYTTNDTVWDTSHYSAIKTEGSLFPQCQGKGLVPCLNSLSESVVCNTLNEGHFYGAKSPRVDGSVCKWTYRVN